jgi:hypothetical protein
MVIVFVHGWSVRNTDAYGQLPERLKAESLGAGINLDIRHVVVSRYVSFDDSVTLDDIARAFDKALRANLSLKAGERFACITHSTGGPVVRKWLDLFYGPSKIQASGLSHLIMLAPANHGSALAQLGKSGFSRGVDAIRGTEPGQRVLDWLELGSDEQWSLNESWLKYRCVRRGVFPFVLTGQTIDRRLYDHLNSYTAEPGSDGVVRVSAANMQYSHLTLRQAGRHLEIQKRSRSETVAFGILPGTSHSGQRMGIIRSVPLQDPSPLLPHPTVFWVLRCLSVRDRSEYARVRSEFAELTTKTQLDERVQTVHKLVGKATYITSRYSMLIFKLQDERGNPLTTYDLILTAGPESNPNELPQGFFQDRQRNKLNLGKLTYYVDYDAMDAGLMNSAMQGKLGLRVVAHPVDSGLAYYRVAELLADRRLLEEILQPNQTVMVEITLRRHVDTNVYSISPDLQPAEFDGMPSGTVLD